jgi:hypothetical protein
MECISCGLRAGYNRVIIEEVQDTEVGGFCRNCELEAFGETLSKCSNKDQTCLLCNRDGWYALSSWEPYEKTSEYHITTEVDFSVTERTPRLCDEHFHELCLQKTQTSDPRRTTR